MWSLLFKRCTKFYLLILDVNDYELPLWFRPGNRYEVTVYGRQHKDTHSKVVYKKSIEFRTGEGVAYFYRMFLYL